MLENIIIMKYGVHAGESIANIIDRKLSEIELTGHMYWGYGGTLCHPITQVQPFLKDTLEKGKSVYLLLTSTKSNNYNDFNESQEFSYNKKEWFSVPENIHIYGSKYALICNELQKCDFDIDLRNYKISVGSSKDKLASDYFKGRVDKCCASRITSDEFCAERSIIKVSWIAKVENAVFLK